MAPPSRRGQPWVRQLRLATGLILFTFVTTHLLNHALGLISLDAMEAGRWWFLAPLAQPAGHGSRSTAPLLTHIALALWVLYQRRHLCACRRPTPRSSRSGLVLPACWSPTSWGRGSRTSCTAPGLLQPRRPRAVGAPPGRRRPPGSHARAGVDPRVHRAPHFGSASARGIRARAPRSSRVALLLAGAGRCSASSRAAARPRRGARAAGWPDGGAARGQRADARRGAHAARHDPREPALDATARLLWASSSRGPADPGAARRRGTVRLRYPGRRAWSTSRGASPSSRRAASPASRTPPSAAGEAAARPAACASTGAATDLPPPAEAERRVLRRVGAPPNVRLACQLRPTRDVDVVPLLPATARARRGRAARGVGLGPGAGGRRPVRRHARLHALGRAQAALRRRVLPEPVLRGGRRPPSSRRAASPTSSPATA